jgi:predicted transglutaminase-like cysteine proteinase
VSESLEELASINRKVNHSVTYKDDLKQYGVAEHWAYPTSGYGDCEDYALLKRKLLIDAGFDPKKLNVALCWDLSKQGHAVLIAELQDADYVLDNHTDLVKPWGFVGYKWDKVSIDGSFLHWKKITA